MELNKTGALPGIREALASGLVFAFRVRTIEGMNKGRQE